ncbi:MAG: amidohydrolase [Phycisphaerae bacterium]
MLTAPHLRPSPAIFIFAAIVCAQVATAESTTTFYVNGNIHTMSEAKPHADAMAVRAGRIIAIGTEAEVRQAAGEESEIIDLRGRTVLPGLIDAHGHLLGLGAFGVGKLDLSGAKSFDEVIAAVREKAAAAKQGEWIVGGRWDHESWPDKKLPSHAALSAATPDNPVWITRVDGHAGLANAAAMKLADVDGRSVSPSGGEILKDDVGQPTGIFVDRAMGLIGEKIPAGQFDTAAMLLKAQEMCFSVGLTGVHVAGVSPEELKIYQSLADSGKLKLRVHVMIDGADAIEYFTANEPRSGEVLNVRACKLYMDGALGSRGAWMLEPYADRATDAERQPYTGLALTPRATMEEIVAAGLRLGFQVCTHAIGDRANREVLDIYEAALKGPEDADARFRIEHAQILSEADIPRFAQLGVIASMQPTHCTSDMRWVEDRIGSERAAGAYAWRSLKNAGARLALGSDFAVESHNPFLGIYAAVTRQDADGNPPNGWRASERLTREEALAGFSRDAAYASFDEDNRGTLAVGKFADFVVIDRDVMNCPESEIREAKVLATYVGGNCVAGNVP